MEGEMNLVGVGDHRVISQLGLSQFNLGAGLVLSHHWLHFIEEGSPEPTEGGNMNGVDFPIKPDKYKSYTT